MATPIVPYVVSKQWAANSEQSTGVSEQDSAISGQSNKKLFNENRSLFTELRDFLQTKLPDYMIPAFIIILENLPLTPNGKVDRGALPAPEPISGPNYIPSLDPLFSSLICVTYSSTQI